MIGGFRGYYGQAYLFTADGTVLHVFAWPDSPPIQPLRPSRAPARDNDNDAVLPQTVCASSRQPALSGSRSQLSTAREEEFPQS